MRNFFGILLVPLACAVAVGVESGRSERREERAQSKDGRSAHVVFKMRRVAVPRPERIRNSEHIVRENRHIEAPRRDDQGVELSHRAVTSAPRHARLIGNARSLRAIERERRLETVRGRYYWHTDADLRYCHYYDSLGVHWYGFYRGSEFYWTRYHARRWWWWDAGFARWVFWHEGYWWWQDPAGVDYVYVDNSYYPYESMPQAVTVKTPEVQAPPAAP